ncbi:MAG: amidohydrolase [Planctomycetota bacterium]
MTPETTRREFLTAAAAGTAALAIRPMALGQDNLQAPADLILINGKVTTMDPTLPDATALACSGDKFVAVGSDADIQRLAGPQTKVINASGKRVVPGLNDSHMHFVRECLVYNLETRWDGVDSLAEAMGMLREQAKRTPKGQWIRVIGGFSQFQFKERRMPTLEELNAVTPDHPVFILYLYAYALLNTRAMEYLGYDQPSRPTYPGGRYAFDDQGNATGGVYADPSGLILYKSISNGPRLGPADRINSSLHYQREMHSLGVTSVSDCGGGGMVYPDAYGVIQQLNADGRLKVRTSMNTFPQVKGREEANYRRWVKEHKPGDGDDMLYLGGAGENICWAAYDYEIFKDTRPDIDKNAEQVQQPIIDLLTKNNWPTRQHMTYNETIERLLGSYEMARKKVGGRLDYGPRMIVDHAETITEKNMERIAAMGGGIAVQNRIIYQAEDFAARYGADALKQAPPIRKMLKMGLPVCGGTDGTRVASYNPWLSLAWLCNGKSLGGMQMYGDDNLLDRYEALRLWTVNSAWSTGHEGKKGAIAKGQLADFLVLNNDFFAVPDNQIAKLQTSLTAVGGEVVYAVDDLAKHDVPPLPKVSPDWSPVEHFGGYQH